MHSLFTKYTKRKEKKSSFFQFSSGGREIFENLQSGRRIKKRPRNTVLDRKARRQTTLIKQLISQF